MSATLSDRELLKQLRDALVRSNNALNVLAATNHQHDAEIIAAADARLAAPVQSHEAWVDRVIELAKDFGLNDFRNHAEKYLCAHLNNHPAAGI